MRLTLAYFYFWLSKWMSYPVLAHRLSTHFSPNPWSGVLATKITVLQFYHHSPLARGSEYDEMIIGTSNPQLGISALNKRAALCCARVAR